MSGVFQPSFVIAEDNTVVALRFVESINISRDGEEQVLDKLKDDRILYMTTASGKTYDISARKQLAIIGKQYKIPTDIDELRTAIFERWLNLVSN